MQRGGFSLAWTRARQARWSANAASTSRQYFRTRQSTNAMPVGRCASCGTRCRRSTTWERNWNSMSHRAARLRRILISSRIDLVQRTNQWLVVLSIASAAIVGCSRQSESVTPPNAREQPRIYVADWANHRIVRINDMRGSGWVALGSAERSEQAFQFPVGVCVDAIGRIYVSEQYHHRILRMDDMLGGKRVEFLPPDAADKPVNKYAGSWICLDKSG